MQTPRHHTITKSLGSGDDKGRSRCRLRQAPPLPSLLLKNKQTRRSLWRGRRTGEQGITHSPQGCLGSQSAIVGSSPGLSHIRQRPQNSRHVRIEICDRLKPIASHRVCHHICQGIIAMPRTPKPMPWRELVPGAFLAVGGQDGICLHRSLGGLSSLAYGSSRSSHFPQSQAGPSALVRRPGAWAACQPHSTCRSMKRGAYERGFSWVVRHESSVQVGETNILMTCSRLTASNGVPGSSWVPILFQSRNRNNGEKPMFQPERRWSVMSKVWATRSQQIIPFWHEANVRTVMVEPGW